MDYRWIRDLIFKGVFGSEPNKKVLAAFLNKLLGYENENQIIELTIENPFVMSDVTIFDKLVILDVTARDGIGKVYHIEVQVNPDKDFPLRLAYYHAQLISSQLAKGHAYSQLPTTITIAIIGDFIMYDETEDIHSTFRYLEEKKHFQLGDTGEIHIVELQKYHIQKPEDAKTSLERWLYLLKYGDYLAKHKELPENFKKEKEMEQAMSTYKILVSDDKFRAQLEAKEKFDNDQISRFVNAQREGKQIGLAEGEQIAIMRVAKNMLESGMDFATVVKLTGLTEDKLRRL